MPCHSVSIEGGVVCAIQFWEVFMKKILLIVTVLLVVVPTATLGQQTGDPAATVASFHQALTSGEKEQVLGLLSPDLILYEDSGKEASRAEYASGHLGADMKFSAQAKRKVLEQSVKISGSTSWVMTRYSVKGKAGGKKIKLESAETMVLEKMPDGWQIVHVHWSNKIL
jgi:ketosteroid isomerase-like protein